MKVREGVGQNSEQLQMRSSIDAGETPGLAAEQRIEATEQHTLRFCTRIQQANVRRVVA